MGYYYAYTRMYNIYVMYMYKVWQLYVSRKLITLKNRRYERSINIIFYHAHSERYNRSPLSLIFNKKCCCSLGKKHKKIKCFFWSNH